ncbi:MAG: DNA translocase FtsK [Pirellulales bacterium]
MTEPARKIEFDVEAIVLSAICIFIWMSLLSYDPADNLNDLPRPLKALVAVDNAVYPPNEHIQNACGWTGAVLANILVQSFGVGSLLVAAGLTVLAVWMFRVQTNFVPPVRQVGWVLVIIGTTTLFALMGLHTPFSPTIGPGGYIGAITSTWLHDHFALFGASIMTIAILMAGLLLSTDYMVVRAVGWVVLGGGSWASSAAKKRVSLPTAGKSKKSSDVDQGVQLGETGEPTVKISGRATSEEVAAEAAKSDAAKADGAKSDAKVEGKVASTVKSMLGGLLGTKEQPADATSEATALASDAAEAGAEVSSLEDEVEVPAEPSSEQLSLTAEPEEESSQLRADLPHDKKAGKAEPSVRPPKSKSAKEDHAATLAALDDTKLPPGSDEYVLPNIDLLTPSDDIDFEAQTVEVRRKAKILEATFKNFGLNVRVVEIETGPVIAQYEIELEAGLRLSKITSLADDLAIALRVPSVRIVAPIPGKNTVGIEVPNENRQVVRLREVIEEMGAKGKKAKIPLFLGKDVSGNPLIADLASLPHLLIAGRTGTGKSVCLNAIITSILMTRRPDEVRMLLIDPKMVEMIGYGRLPHLMHPVVTDMRKAEAILAWAVDKMEERYTLLARAGVRHLTNYNELDREELLERIKPETPEDAEAIPDHLPFIVIVADEMADLMMTAGKDVEQHIIRLAQKSRAVGIHLILATQKPTVDVITGLIKSNLPARISFQVASRTDSRVVLDEMGADKLLGNGDMLFLWPGTSTLLRGQGTYLSDEEINRVVDHCSTGEQNFVSELVNLKVKDENEGEEPSLANLRKRDDLAWAAIDVVVREGRGSCSLLQRALGIGYGRAARLIDFMAEDGIVGQYAGSQAREVIISLADWEAMQAAEGGAVPAKQPPQRSNKIRPDDARPDDARESDKPEPKPPVRSAITPSKPVRIVPAQDDVDEPEDDDDMNDRVDLDGDFDSNFDGDNDSRFSTEDSSDNIPWQDSKRTGIQPKYNPSANKSASATSPSGKSEPVKSESAKSTTANRKVDDDEGDFDFDGDDIEYEDVED